jgi:hypothetical protein
MNDWSIPLVVAAAAFLAVLVWRVRPILPWGGASRVNDTLRATQARVEAAADDAERAVALCEAADALAGTMGRRAAAAALYLRAMRTDPKSVRVVERAAAALSRRPRLLESVLWRHLGATSWTGASLPAVRASIDALRAVYERPPLRNAARARALANALAVLQDPSA